MKDDDDSKPPILRNHRRLGRLILIVLIGFALLYFGVGATAFFRTQPPPL